MHALFCFLHSFFFFFCLSVCVILTCAQGHRLCPYLPVFIWQISPLKGFFICDVMCFSLAFPFVFYFTFPTFCWNSPSIWQRNHNKEGTMGSRLVGPLSHVFILHERQKQKQNRAQIQSWSLPASWLLHFSYSAQRVCGAHAGGQSLGSWCTWAHAENLFSKS